MTKTLKQFKEDMQIYKWNIYKDVYINVLHNNEELEYKTEEEFFEAEIYNDRFIKCVDVFNLSNETHINILLGGN